MLALLEIAPYISADPVKDSSVIWRNINFKERYNLSSQGCIVMRFLRMLSVVTILEMGYINHLDTGRGCKVGGEIASIRM
jgi:hypothetical protein